MSIIFSAYEYTRPDAIEWYGSQESAFVLDLLRPPIHPLGPVCGSKVTQVSTNIQTESITIAEQDATKSTQFTSPFDSFKTQTRNLISNQYIKPPKTTSERMKQIPKDIYSGIVGGLLITTFVTGITASVVSVSLPSSVLCGSLAGIRIMSKIRG